MNISTFTKFTIITSILVVSILPIQAYANPVEDQIIKEHLADIPIIRNTSATVPTNIWYEFRLIPKDHLKYIDAIIFEDSPGAINGLIVLAYMEFTLDGKRYLHVPVQSILETSIIHEVGHAIQCNYIEDFKKFARDDPNDCVTHYACSNPEEDFAESYRMYIMDRLHFKRIAPRRQALTQKYEFMKNLLGEEGEGAVSYGINRLYNDYTDENIRERDICRWFKPEKKELSLEESLEFTLLPSIPGSILLPENQSGVLAIEIKASHIGDVFISGISFNISEGLFDVQLNEANLYDDLGRFLGKGIINHERGTVTFTQISPPLIVKASSATTVVLSADIQGRGSQTKASFSFTPTLQNIHAEDRDEFVLEDEQLLIGGEPARGERADIKADDKSLEADIHITKEGSPPAQQEPANFTDVSRVHRNHDAIQYLANKKILSGFGDGSFGPSRAISRAELLKVTMNAAGIELSNSAQQTFPDVISNHWSIPYIQTAVQKGWVRGFEDGLFRPNKTVSKAEALKIIANVLGVIPEGSHSSSFKDVDKTHWSHTYIAHFEKHTWIEEVSGAHFHPHQAMTRASVSEILYRALKAREPESFNSSP